MSIAHNHIFGFTPKLTSRPQTRKFLELARNRMILKTSILMMALMCIIGRLVNIVISTQSPFSISTAKLGGENNRGELIDMNGETLASTITTASLVANAQKIENITVVAQRLVKALPKLKMNKVVDKLNSGKTFIWLARHLSPRQQAAVLKLGIPGLDLINDEKRIYPHGRLLAHVAGMTNIDNQGIAGAELAFENRLAGSRTPVQLSIDIRAQEIAYNELSAGIEKFKAEGGNVIIMHIPTGEIRAMVSMPDFEPSRPPLKNSKALFNRNLVGVYEMGSTMKIINTTMSLSAGAVTLKTRYDTSEALTVGRFRITDFRGTNSWLTVPQGFVRSSNLCASRMAIEAGVQAQKNFFEKMGLLKPMDFEVTEKGYPLFPRHWTEASLVTISYGYGVAITPLHLIKVIGTIINNGQNVRPTILKGGNKNYAAEQIISPTISKQIRGLMRLTMTEGTSRKADLKNYFVIGKTGTANKRALRGYQKDKVDAGFVGAIGADIDNLEYVIVVMLDNPRRLPETFGFNNAGWNAAPIAGKIMNRLAVLYGISPNRQVHSEPYENKIMKLVSYHRVQR